VSGITPLDTDRGEGPLFDPAAPLVATGNLRRRQAVSRAVAAIATASALAAVAVLGIVVFGVAQHGASAISFKFLTTDASVFGTGGGIRSAIIGTALIVTAASLIATPIGILTGLYLTEFAGPRSRVASLLKLALDLMQGLPTIIVGVVIFGLIVAADGESGVAGSVALAIIMLPLIARASQEVLLLVPNSLREAADALGVARWRTVLSVILPTAIGGILTGVILAVARAAGETAPLLLLDHLFRPATTVNLFGAMPNIPVTIYEDVGQASPDSLASAWGGAFALLTAILIANVFARVMLARSRARMMR
jgi:phosphate transport system permease protein